MRPGVRRCTSRSCRLSRARLCAALVVLGAGPLAAVARDARGDAANGERLFYGQARLANGGPACAACHDVAGLPSGGGGTMGPELTGAFEKYGPEPLDTVLATLFFPTMEPLFVGRLLTPGERSDIEAFLADASQRRPSRGGATTQLLLASVLLFAALAAVIAGLGRAGLRGVRKPLVRRAQRSRRTVP